MKRHLALTILLTTGLIGCIDINSGSPTAPAHGIWGSGHLVTQSRPVSGVESVLLSGAGELLIEHTGYESLTLTAEENLIDHLTTEVVGGQLILGTESGVDVNPTQPILYRLTVIDIEQVSLSGAGRIELDGIARNRLAVVLSGAGTIVANGTVQRQSFTLSGAGRYEARNLVSTAAAVTMSGAGHAIIRASRRLEGVVSGAGILEYYGDPEVSVTVSGAGVVRRVGG